jgi:hypothetical protein
MTFWRWGYGVLVLTFALQAVAVSVFRCVDAQGRVTFADQPCEGGTRVRPDTPPGSVARERIELTPEKRKGLLAEVQVALEQQWQKQVELTLDASGFSALNRSTQDVYWFVTPAEPTAWIPVCLDNRIAPGQALRVPANERPSGTAFKFHWWYKGSEVNPGSAYYSADRVRSIPMRTPPRSGARNRQAENG